MNLEVYRSIVAELSSTQARLIAVSKTKPVSDIQQLYDAGQRLFGENKVQELTDKQAQLPHDIEWHLIGHLQTNKVKYVAPFVSMIHAVDSLKLLEEINKQAQKNGRVIDCLLQIYIAQEETKFGLDSSELTNLLSDPAFNILSNVRICGLMGMATNTDHTEQIEREFASLNTIYDTLKQTHFRDKPYFKELSMGMSSDYKIAVKHGATMVRIGSTIFGSR